MDTVSPGRGKIVRERACVLYDRDTGAIRHIQHVMVMEGGYDPDEGEVEAMCRDALVKRGHKHDKLEALHVDRDALKPFKGYRVETARKMLVEHEHVRNKRS
jgi:hypothetical protein